LVAHVARERVDRGRAGRLPVGRELLPDLPLGIVEELAPYSGGSIPLSFITACSRRSRSCSSVRY
jgi:hypothetical protein